MLFIKNRQFIYTKAVRSLLLGPCTAEVMKIAYPYWSQVTVNSERRQKQVLTKLLTQAVALTSRVGLEEFATRTNVEHSDPRNYEHHVSMTVQCLFPGGGAELANLFAVLQTVDQKALKSASEANAAGIFFEAFDRHYQAMIPDWGHRFVVAADKAATPTVSAVLRAMQYDRNDDLGIVIDGNQLKGHLGTALAVLASMQCAREREDFSVDSEKVSQQYIYFFEICGRMRGEWKRPKYEPTVPNDEKRKGTRAHLRAVDAAAVRNRSLQGLLAEFHIPLSHALIWYAEAYIHACMQDRVGWKVQCLKTNK